MDYYEELAVKNDATLDEIKQSYRRLAKKYHPDKNPDNEQAAQRFVKIATAYETLGDEQKRQEYDKQLGVKNKQSNTKSKEQYASTVNINPMDMSNFESFFGFTTSGDKVVPTTKSTNQKAKPKPMDTSPLFEKFFGDFGK